MSTITIVEGQHIPFTYRDEMPSQPMDSGQTTLMDSVTLVYQEPDWFLFSKDSAFQGTQFTLVYDGQASYENDDWYTTDAFIRPTDYSQGVGYTEVFGGRFGDFGHTHPIPEPSTYALLVVGFVALALIKRYRHVFVR